MEAFSLRARASSGSTFFCNLLVFAHVLALLILVSLERQEPLLLSSKAAAAAAGVTIKPCNSRFVIRREHIRSSGRGHPRNNVPFAIDGVERKVRVRNWLGNLFGGGDKGESSEATEFPEGTFEYVQPPIDTSSILPGTALSGRELARCYQASVHGWEATDFHERCDNKGPSLVIARTAGGEVVGGFMPLEWKSSNDYRETNMDFLFYATPDEAPTKLQKKDFSPVYDYRRGGPQWGSEVRNENYDLLRLYNIY